MIGAIWRIGTADLNYIPSPLGHASQQKGGAVWQQPGFSVLMTTRES